MVVVPAFIFALLSTFVIAAPAEDLVDNAALNLTFNVKGVGINQKIYSGYLNASDTK